jgi:hypothetical protein
VTTYAQLSLAQASPAAIEALIGALIAADRGHDTSWADPDSEPESLWWASVEQSDGYTVARCDAGRWRTGRAHSSDLAAFAPENLLEMRVFRPGTELCCFRDGNGSVRGVWRRLDNGPVAGPLRMRRRTLRLTWGDHDSAGGDTGFTTLRRPDGTRTVVPVGGALGVPALRVRQHYTKDATTGAVRAAVTCYDAYIHGGGSDA